MSKEALLSSTHDCKDYIRGYIELHRKYQLEVRVCSACGQVHSALSGSIHQPKERID